MPKKEDNHKICRPTEGGMRSRPSVRDQQAEGIDPIEFALGINWGKDVCTGLYMCVHV